MKKEITKQMSEKLLGEMATSDFRDAFINLLKCRYPIFYVVHNEEKRFVEFLQHYCRVHGREGEMWNSYEGMVDILSGEQTAGISTDAQHNALAILDHIISEGKSFEHVPTAKQYLEQKKIKGKIYVLLDFFRFIQETPDVERRLRTISSLNSIMSVIITGPYYKSTDILVNLIPTITLPYPNRQEIRQALYGVVSCVKPEDVGDLEESTKAQEEKLINAVTGLTLTEAQTAFSKSIVSQKGWSIPTILEEKKQIIGKSGLLEYFAKTVDMSEVGGMKNLTHWVEERRDCFSEEAAGYGLRKPRGVLLLGLPGTGKSYSAKAISSCWQFPLLRLDFGKLFQSYVGDSERNARSAISQAEAIAPVILWIDEIDKAVSGAQSSGRNDNGVVSRVISTFLTWMQEKESPVFVVATSNNYDLPPEFLRAGRFDEVFFVDLPNIEERSEIFEIHLKKKKQDLNNFSLLRLSKASEGYSGAEIEKAVEKGMIIGFYDNKRPITTEDILQAMKSINSLSKMRGEEFETIREWASTRCTKANVAVGSQQSYFSDAKKELEIS